MTFPVNEKAPGDVGLVAQVVEADGDVEEGVRAAFEELNCLLMLQYLPAFTIPIVEDFAQLASQALE